MVKARDKSISSPDDPSDSALSFEQAMQELDGLVRRIESGELSLEDSVQAYQRGAELVKHCRETLNRVEQRVAVLEADMLVPLELDDAADADADE
jgi:exodeoxyribonuclease VII small subunit